MANSALGGDLPAYMRVGRGTVPGPFSGAYAVLSANSAAVGSSETGLPFLVIEMPANFRVEALIYYQGGGVAANADLLAIENTATLTSGSGTTMTTISTLSLDTLGSNAGFNVRNANEGGDYDLVEAQRNVTKGNYIAAYVTTDGTGTLGDTTLHAVGFFYGHANVDPGND